MMKRNKDTIKAAEDLEKKKAQKLAADRRREAREDAEAKRRIREMIEADKRARREKQQQETNAESSNAARNSTNSSAAPQAAVASKPTPSRAAPTESRLRIRVERSGTQMMKTYAVDTTLASVAHDLAPEVGIPATSILFITTFPTRSIGHSEFGRTLKDAGLVNASVIIRSA
jgi:type III secretory pathway component EscV